MPESQNRISKLCDSLLINEIKIPLSVSQPKIYFSSVFRRELNVFIFFMPVREFRKIYRREEQLAIVWVVMAWSPGERFLKVG
jgi:hypothetical protein